ncbi:metallophosphoesterase [Paenibacillus radicis (ex Xue et al. 2023)]|uniref:Metallophosphoesterase n=1 Tax=Paenibacillus radicis (ex Xue et al. 2023) TaxID=2972489 RepID=A0ABT1YPK5_9BACL|nr:metallophosphoesterase [Paenibacillus radicis (ex Xue et al. 2023)]MCR8635110.1 metallophosphoesterase [Paenibacillus radicis (ex Xue et al. 2023)]
MKPRFYFIIAIVLLVFALINYYIGWHGQLWVQYVFHFSPGPLYWICFWLIVFSYVIGRLGSKFLPHGLSSFLRLIGAYWLAIMLFSFVMLPFIDLAAGVMALLSVEKTVYIPVLGLAAGLILLALMIRGSWNARNPIIRRYEITIPKSAGDRTELRIAVASDLHLGTIVGNKQLQLLVEKMNSLKPDLILLPGDIIDDDIKPFIRQDMGSIMKKLESRLGIYAVLGNHEYIGGHIKEFVNQMSAIGIEVLLDRPVLIDNSFYVIGRKDKAVERFGSDGRMDLEALLTGVDKSLPLILMDHQPYGLDKAAAAGVDVMLSGHTHRGQMSPNHYITRRIFELDWGYLKKGAMHAIVSSGYGTWGPPIRIGSRSELIELVVHFKG